MKVRETLVTESPVNPDNLSEKIMEKWKEREKKGSSGKLRGKFIARVAGTGRRYTAFHLNKVFFNL